jgi:protein TonB
VNRHLIIAGSVILFHMAALWALQFGLRSRPIEVIVPAEIMLKWVIPAAPVVTPPPPTPLPAPPKSTPVKQVEKKMPAPAKVPTPVPVPMPMPMPLTIADPTPAPTAPTGVREAPMAAALQEVSAPAAVNSKAAPSSTPALPLLVLPSSDADYLQNPRPPYPALSKRLGEQGKVVVRVLIGVDGTAQKTEIKQSSGFDRLDQAALATVLRWRYVPGKRAGVPEAMWFNVPISFVLE